MAGHSKWANIKHRKQAEDARRGKLFTRLIRAIKHAARSGGGLPETNSGLRNAIDAARSANMSNDVIERAVKQGIGDIEGQQLEQLHYEGYGPGGVAILIECMSDNRNRTVAEVRHVLTKYGGNMGAAGSVSYLFTRHGILTFAATVDENSLLECALDAGAEDVRSSDEGEFEVITSPEAFVRIKTALAERQLIPMHAEVTMEAAVQCVVPEQDTESLLKMLEKLEELDDVQQVHTNAAFAHE